MFELWVDELEEIFNATFMGGTTRFFNNPYDAQEWVETNIILSNPRLSDFGDPSQRDILFINSNESLNFAIAQTSDPAVAASLYWAMMQDYIMLNTYDEKLQNVFEQGKQAAQDTAELSFDEDVESNFKIPWWLVIFPLALLFMRKK